MFVLFDTNVWRAVSEPSSSAEEALGSLFDQLTVVGSTEVVIELNRIPDVKQRGAQLERFFGLVGSRLLWGFQTRTELEAASGGLLDHQDRYVGEAQLECLRNFLDPGSYQAGQIDSPEPLGAEMASMMRLWSAEVRTQIENMETENDLRSSLRDLRSALKNETHINLVARGIALRHGLVGADEIGAPGDMAERIPSLWAACAYHLARLAAVTADGNKTAVTDRIDNFVVSAIPYVDLLVTQDRAMRRAAGLMLSPPQVMSIDECVEFVSKGPLQLPDEMEP